MNEDHPKAKLEFSELINNNEEDSNYILAYRAENGYGWEQDIETAIEYYYESALLGHEKSINRLKDLANKNYFLAIEKLSTL